MDIIRKLAKRVKGFTIQTIITPLFMVGEVVLEVFIPTIMGKMIDEGISKTDMPTTIRYSIVLVVMCLASLLCGALAGWFAATASCGFAKNLRRDLYFNVQNFSFKNIDKFSTGSLVTRLTTDVTNVQNSFQMLIRIAVRCPLMLITSLVMAFGISKKLSLIFLIVIPIIGFTLGIIIMKVMPAFEKMFKFYDKLNNIVQENLHGIRVVKSFVREDYEYEHKFKNTTSDIRNTAVYIQKFLTLNGPAMTSAVYICILLLSWFGGKMIVNSNRTELDVGQLTALISYVTQILMSCMMLSMIFVMLTTSAASAKRVVEVLDEKSDIESPENPVTEVKDGSVKFDNVSFGYTEGNDTLCVRNVSLDIPSGATVGIIGATGSAKSTLVQLIPRLYDASYGNVYVGGVNVKDYDLDILRREVSMVLQTNTLFSGTIKENLRWGDENATDEEIVTACKHACADEFVREFPDGYDTYIEQGGTNVSGGQKQRLCIARALLRKPKILILDDSTSAVDTRTDAMIRDAFKNDIPDTTKIIIAQRISSVEHSDMIVVLDNGTISDVGTHEELLKVSSIYKEVYDSQTKGGDSNG